MIRLRGLRKRLGRKQVLDGVDLEIPTGCTMVVMGQSGTGKSVLLKHIIGLMRPDEGAIEVDGTELTSLRERDLDEVRKRFGMLFQGSALFDSLSVGENVALPMREHTAMRESEIRARVAERLEWVGLTGIEEMKPASLSGGMRKRVGLARAIAIDPAYILYDEPTTGLDPIMSDVINRLDPLAAAAHRCHLDRRHARPAQRVLGGGPDGHAARGPGRVHRQRRGDAHDVRSARPAVHRGVERRPPHERCSMSPRTRLGHVTTPRGPRRGRRNA
jgi:phospholipid/cholesterol/gamma-HCH transport system ATP-binding protein